MIELIAATCGGFLAGWICRGLQLPMVPPRGSYGYRHPSRNSNGNCVPMPPAPDWRRSFNHENVAPNSSEQRPLSFTSGGVVRGNGHGGPSTPKPPIKPQPSGGRIIYASGMASNAGRWFINNPAQIAECGGPCTAGPSHCDCGALWLDVVGLPAPPEAP